MMTEQPLTQWMDAYGTEIFRLCYLALRIIIWHRMRQ